MPPRPHRPHVLAPAFVAAACVPALLAYNLPPSPTFFNQIAGLALWGVVALLCAPTGSPHPLARDIAALTAALTICLIAAAGSAVIGALPAGLSLSAIGLIAATMVTAACGAQIAAHLEREAIMAGFFAAWLTAGLASVFIGALQVFFPELPDGEFIARSGLVGRAVGNLRQPNHLSTLLLWSAAAVIPLVDARRLRRGMAVAMYAAIIFGIVITGSRTGIVGAVVLTLWGLLDRRMTRDARLLLLSTPVLFGSFWALMWWWANETQNTFGAAAHVLGAELSSSRFAIWRNAIHLIVQHPWLGVGFGEFNFAWTLAAFPDRPVAFFDHTHNLPLQLAVELGIPLSIVVLSLLTWALWQAWRRSTLTETSHIAARTAFVMVLMMALHSQLEYPLWYAYFLLPTAWAWGYCLGISPTPLDKRVEPQRMSWRAVAGAGMIAASGIACADYLRVVRIFAPGENAGPLAERIVDGQRSLLFAHHADYAAVTTSEDLATASGKFDRAPHYLLDTRLMIAWARALARQGDVDRARYIADRLREFRNPAADEFFASCEAPPPRPFQCERATQAHDWREFR